ncbi:hypothetical protein [Halomarina rubra]|uniref:HNH endonuclease n=1 Tax=Halomarina rubra TaxID=2071873 RepID=A0ABD6AZY1_9EURY|nr:hypothetical protein [Halomarina rubra]
MSHGTAHIKDATADGQLRAQTFIRKLREGCVVRIRTRAGTYTVRQNPRAERRGRREFTVIHHGYGGGFVGRFGQDAGTIERHVEHAEGERALRIGGRGDWPDHPPVPEDRWGGA